jgi:GntR family transcriptional regulator
LTTYRWDQIADILRQRILSGQIRPGAPFPTNLDIAHEFGAQLITVHLAVKALTEEGLLLTQGRRRRIVQARPRVSPRYGGFLDESPDGWIQIDGIQPVEDPKDVPPELRETLPRVPGQVFGLRYRVRQWRDGIVVAISDSFIPTQPFAGELDRLGTLLRNPRQELYAAMIQCGVQPRRCEERLRAGFPTQEELQNLMMSPSAKLPVVRIIRTVFDKENRLLEFCCLTDRADAYEFRYSFPLKAKRRS